MTIGNNTIEALHQAYSKESDCELTQDQFVTLLTFYPALLVVAADGEIDKDEILYVKHIAKFMANSYGESHNYHQSSLEKQFYKNLMYIHENSKQWEQAFLKVLHNYLKEVPLLKENIVEVMIMFAESSEQISETEHKLIKNIANQLDIDISLLDIEH